MQISLGYVINLLVEQCGYFPHISVDDEFIRHNEIQSLSGCSDGIVNVTEYKFKYFIKDTLKWMSTNKLDRERRSC